MNQFSIHAKENAVVFNARVQSKLLPGRGAKSSIRLFKVQDLPIAETAQAQPESHAEDARHRALDSQERSLLSQASKLA